MLAALAAAAAIACGPAPAFTGTLCTPAAAGKHPAVLLLGGSEGGDQMRLLAPRFAQKGYVAASVAYFGMPGLPKELVNIPVETVGKALDAIAKRADVDPNRIAIVGMSKGGEFALLAASTYPQIHAVVADVPSPFAWQGISYAFGVPQSSWSLGGKPVPFVQYGAAMGAAFANTYQQGKPLDLRPGYDASMQGNAAQIPAAMFHLENIRGPVLMLAADDDQIWDSVAQCRIGMAYLHDRHHPYADQLLQYAAAGHAFLFSTPQHPLVQSASGGMTMLLGGTPQGNIAAADAAWPKIAAFLSVSLK